MKIASIFIIKSFANDFSYIITISVNTLKSQIFNFQDWITHSLINKLTILMELPLFIFIFLVFVDSSATTK